MPEQPQKLTLEAARTFLTSLSFKEDTEFGGGVFTHDEFPFDIHFTRKGTLYLTFNAEYSFLKQKEIPFTKQNIYKLLSAFHVSFNSQLL